VIREEALQQEPSKHSNVGASTESKQCIGSKKYVVSKVNDFFHNSKSFCIYKVMVIECFYVVPDYIFSSPKIHVLQ